MFVVLISIKTFLIIFGIVCVLWIICEYPWRSLCFVLFLVLAVLCFIFPTVGLVAAQVVGIFVLVGVLIGIAIWIKENLLGKDTEEDGITIIDERQILGSPFYIPPEKWNR